MTLGIIYVILAATWAKGYSEPSTCLVSQVQEMHKTSASIDCDAVPFSLVASECRVTYNCDAGSRQYNLILTCDSLKNEWTGEVKCISVEEIALFCELDFETLQVPEQCPITLEQFMDHRTTQELDFGKGRSRIARNTNLAKICAKYCRRSPAEKKRYCTGRRKSLCSRCVSRCRPVFGFGKSFLRQD